MSRRAFDRKFRAAVGDSPMRWLLHQRVLHAQRLLEGTDLSVDAIARHVGLGAGVSLRPHFRRQVGTSPQAYRQAFRAIDASGRLSPDPGARSGPGPAAAARQRSHCGRRVSARGQDGAEHGQERGDATGPPPLDAVAAADVAERVQHEQASEAPKHGRQHRSGDRDRDPRARLTPGRRTRHRGASARRQPLAQR